MKKIETTTENNIAYLSEVSKTLRKDVIEMLHSAKSGHPGGALSSADIISVLYFGDILKVDPNDPYNPERDLYYLLVIIVPYGIQLLREEVFSQSKSLAH